jgi:hypothetical protein
MNIYITIGTELSFSAGNIANQNLDIQFSCILSVGQLTEQK